ncbi:MAG: hypothetical protein HUJ53_04185, partial [Holdemanella sp.]|nr:hypothetical protein [Holdemanella sp.]
FLFSNGIYLNTDSYFSFLISKAILNQKNKYYKAFKDTEDIHEYGCLNGFVESISSILMDELKDEINEITEKRQRIQNLQIVSDLTASEQKIYALLAETTILSYFGISNEEIINELNISKRTLMYALKKFREKDLLIETKVGKFNFIKLKNIE